MSIVAWLVAWPLLGWAGRRGWPKQLASLEGRTLGIGRPRGTPLKLRISNGRARPAPPGASADVTVRARPSIYVAIWRGQLDPDAAFFQREIELEGSLRVAIIAKNVFDGFLG